MKVMNEDEMLATLKGAGVGSRVFVSYLAGRPNKSLRGLLERRRAEVEGFSLRHFTGTFEGIKKNKKGDYYLLCWVEERDAIADTGDVTQGNWRAMNPSLGHMLTVEVLEPMMDCWFAL